MFTLEDIKPLVRVEGACAVLIKIDPNEIDPEMAKITATQIKKATKLPVIFVFRGMEIEMTTEKFIDNGKDSDLVSRN